MAKSSTMPFISLNPKQECHLVGKWSEYLIALGLVCSLVNPVEGAPIISLDSTKSAFLIGLSIGIVALGLIIICVFKSKEKTNSTNLGSENGDNKCKENKEKTCFSIIVPENHKTTPENKEDTDDKDKEEGKKTLSDVTSEDKETSTNLDPENKAVNDSDDAKEHFSPPRTEKEENSSAILGPESENFVRLLMLITEKGSEVFRRVLLTFTTSKCSVTTFKEVLDIAEKHKKRLTPVYLKYILWPASDQPETVDDLDITTCNGLLLLQPICDLTDGNHETLKQALDKIRDTRNKLCHDVQQKYTEEQFNLTFTEIKDVFKDIANINPEFEIPEEEIAKYKSLPITASCYEEVLDVVQEVLQEATATRQSVSRLEEMVKVLTEKILALQASQEDNFEMLKDSVDGKHFTHKRPRKRSRVGSASKLIFCLKQNTVM